MITCESSLKEFQELNKQIYLVVNDRKYSIQEIFSNLHRHITHILKAVRKEIYSSIEYHLCMALSWSFALANRLHINLAKEMWKSFPGCCPYCLTAPCSCKDRPPERQKMAGKAKGKHPVSMFEWQQMFWRIYPNVILNSAVHLAEEAGEVDETIRNNSATHAGKWFKKTVEELIDVITNIFAVASCRDLNLAAGMASYFAKGCPKCCRLPCRCGYVSVDKLISLSRSG